jgi:hypothetical protein
MNSQSFYMVPGELRAHLASAGEFGVITTSLSETISLSTPLTPREASQLTCAEPGPSNHGADLLPREPTRRYAHSSFVDDTGIVETWDRMVGAITNSILSFENTTDGIHVGSRLLPIVLTTIC